MAAGFLTFNSGTHSQQVIYFTSLPENCCCCNSKCKKKKNVCTFMVTNMLHCTKILQEQLSHLFHIFWREREKKKTASPDTWKLVIFSIASSLCLCDTFSYAFSADICLTLEAVIIAGSVKENSCSNMLLLSVVTEKKCLSDTELAFFRVLSDTTALRLPFR